MVGVVEPCSGSIVIAKALASAPAGSGGLMSTAPPRAAGLKTPAGMGAPCIGISHSSYVFCAGSACKLLAEDQTIVLARIDDFTFRNSFQTDWQHAYVL